MQYQINLLGTQAKKAYKYLFSFGGWILLFLVLWFKGCGGSDSGTTSVTIPAITKVFSVDTIIKHETIKIPKWYKDTKAEKKYLKDISEAEERIIAYQEEIDNMQSEFQWGDSIKQAELYRLATELKNFESNFEDENLKLTINGIIGGNKVKEITPTYTIKEKKIDVPQKQVKFRMLIGGGLGNSLTFDKPLFNGNVGFQNSKGNILRFGYDSEQRITIGYDFSLFKISK
jgi:hypothetical protein